jgi:excisionase family DNA binding protein
MTESLCQYCRFLPVFACLQRITFLVLLYIKLLKLFFYYNVYSACLFFKIREHINRLGFKEKTMQKIDIARASEVLGISKSSLYNHVKNKKIEHFRIEGRILFDKNILDNYLESKIIKAVHDFEKNHKKDNSKRGKK